MRARLDDRHQGERIREGVRIVLAGPPNVGKSSLLNRLAQREAAIVSATPGTTRDVIEVHLDLAGVPVTVSDTAGLRRGLGRRDRNGGHGTDPRHDGRSRSRGVDDGAGCARTAPEARFGCVTGHEQVRSRGKGSAAAEMVDISVSAKTGQNIDGLVERLSDWARQRFANAESALITRDRQRRAIEACCAHLERATTAEGLPLELVAEEVRLAARELARLVGRIDVEDLLDVVFRDFCIGK
jgi:tRNA modification GTPase